MAGNQIQTPFSPTTKPHPLNPLNRGLTSLVLAEYRLVVLRPLCAYSTIFCFCLLSFPCCFCCSRLALFCSVACLCLISSWFPTVFVISCSLAFLSFMQFLLLTLPTVPCFFSLYFFILVFTPILLYKRIQAFVGQIMLIGSKGFWAQFALIYQSHSAEELYSVADLYSTTNRFPLHFFPWTSRALRSSWWAFKPCFSLVFPPYGLLGTDLQKMGINKSYLEK